MSKLQVLIAIGLVSVLGLILAGRNTSSPKQLGPSQFQLDKAVVIQSLQSAVSIPKVCDSTVRLAQFGPKVLAPAGESGQSVLVGFYLDSNKEAQWPVLEGHTIKNYGLKVDWFRAIEPTLVPMSSFKGTKTLYVATLKIKLSPTGPPDARNKEVDLLPATIGRVSFITTNRIEKGGVIVSCYGDTTSLSHE